MPRDVVAELDARLRDDPWHPATLELMSITGDLLQNRGDPRGDLIALELLERGARERGRAAQASAQEAFDDYLSAHERQLFDKLALLRKLRGAIRCEWHGGRMSRLYLDARRLPRGAYQLSAQELCGLLIKCRFAGQLRALDIRVRHIADASGCVETLIKHGDVWALERLTICQSTRPSGHHHTSSQPHISALRKLAPRLWFTTQNGQIAPLIDKGLEDFGVADELLESVDAPMSVDLRVRIGRALTFGRRRSTEVACELLARHPGSLPAFLPALDLLLRPQQSSHARLWLLSGLAALGAGGVLLLPRLRGVTGSPHYSGDERSAAGKTVATITSALATVS